jgi:Predicted membrane protein (DUF2127)
MFKPRDWLDRLFEIGIIAKGLNGLAELVGGLMLFFQTPNGIRHLAVVLTQGELSDDPHDLVARYLLHTANGLTGRAVFFGAVYLLLHGAVKVVLVTALLLNKLGISLHDRCSADFHRLPDVPDCTASQCGPHCTHDLRRRDCRADMARIPAAAADST